MYVTKCFGKDRAGNVFVFSVENTDANTCRHDMDHIRLQLRGMRSVLFLLEKK